MTFQELRSVVLFEAQRCGVPVEKIIFENTLYGPDVEPWLAKRDGDGNIRLSAVFQLSEREDVAQIALDHLHCFKEFSKKTLYVHRPLLNYADVVAWAKAQGFKTTLGDDMHVTIAFSRTPLDWAAAGDHGVSEVRVASSPDRSIEVLGVDGDAVVLRFESEILKQRWQEFIDAGASWDWPSYKPHITISFDAGDVDIENVEPYDGELVFGSEVFAELDENWKDNIEEKEFDESKHPRGQPENAGQFGPGGGGSDSAEGGGATEAPVDAGLVNEFVRVEQEEIKEVPNSAKTVGYWKDDNFPKLNTETAKLVGKKSGAELLSYNCIAGAMGDHDRWWYPFKDGDKSQGHDTFFWPKDAKPGAGVKSFDDLFIRIGRGEVTKNAAVEPGFVKVALYTHRGQPSHASRLVPTGQWLSKMGPMQALTHDLHDLDKSSAGTNYGKIEKIYKIPIAEFAKFRAMQ
jgi:hypothetical protein